MGNDITQAEMRHTQLKKITKVVIMQNHQY